MLQRTIKRLILLCTIICCLLYFFADVRYLIMDGRNKNDTKEVGINGSYIQSDRDFEEKSINFDDINNLPTLDGTYIQSDRDVEEKSINFDDINNLPTLDGTYIQSDRDVEEKSINFDDINNLPTLDHPGYLIPKGEYPQVIWWEKPEKSDNRSEQLVCGTNICTVTWNNSQITNPLTRGIIFYGTNFKIESLPLPRLPHHEWSLFHEESPFTNWILSLDTMISLFNHTATFRRESDYPLATQFIKDPKDWLDTRYIVNTTEKNRLQRDEGLAPVLYVQSNCNPPSDRDTYVRELMKYIKVDAYGRCLNNKEMPELIKGRQKLGDKPYLHFVAKFKFQIAFENANCKDYMTEKVFRPLEVGVVPVYAGSSGIHDFMPSDKAVVVASDFASPKDLADYLNELNADDEKYNEFLKHRKIGKITNTKLEEALQQRKWKMINKRSFKHTMFMGFPCEVCNQVHKRDVMLREHIKDKSRPIKPLKMANSSHLGCPLPSKYERYGRFRTALDFGQSEAEALVRMLHVNETNIENLQKYILRGL